MGHPLRRALPGVVIVIVLGCARTQATPLRPIVPLGETARTVVVVSASPWRTLLRDGLPSVIRDVAALDDGTAIVASGNALFVARGEGRFDAVCAEALTPGDEPTALDASGNAFVAVGGGDRGAIAWARERVDGPCVRVALPPLATGTPERGVSVSLEGSIAWVWSPRGGIARSLDGGLSWSLLPPLPGVIRVFAGARDGTLAVAVQGPDEGERSVAAHRAQVFHLDENRSGDQRWRVVVEDRLRPAAASTSRDGMTHIVDGDGWLRLDASLRVVDEVWIPWSRSAHDAPRIIVAADAGHFFASAERNLYRIGDRGAEPLGTLPGARAVRCIDAAADGTLWAADERTLWRGSFEGPWREETRLPWSALPLAATVRGPRIAVATNDRMVAISEDDGARWRTQRLPTGVGRPLAMAFDERGGLFILGNVAAALGDARRLVQIEAPATEGALTEQPSVFAVDDRWVVVRGGVWTTDDEGAHWTPRFGNDFRRAPERGGNPLAVLDAAFLGHRGIVLDNDYNLWRSEDAGATWRAVTEASTNPVATRNPWGAGPSFISWDGATRLSVLARNALATSDDGGRNWSTREMNVLASATAMDSAGRLALAVQRAWSGPRLCARGEGVVLLVGEPDGFPLAREACAHRGSLVAFDRTGGDVLLLGANGVAWRAALDALYEPEAPTVL